MKTPYFTNLSPLESKILDVLYRLQRASVSTVVQHLPGDSSYDTVRITLGILKKKGYVNHHKEGTRYIYAPVIPADQAKENALNHITKTFFSGSTPRAIQALLGLSSDDLTEQDFADIEDMIAKARKKSN